MLLRCGLRSNVITERLTTADLNSHQLAAQMRKLAKRGLTTWVYSPAGSYWCLTASGRALAEDIKLQQEIIAAHSQPTLTGLPPSQRR